MESRMKNPAYVLPDSLTGIKLLYKATHQGGVTKELLELVSLRASQINGCSACVLSHVQAVANAEKTATVAAWRESPFFDDAERAALALAEAMTRLADRSQDSVSDELWDEVADHYDEQQLSAIILTISLTNFFNRINTTIKEPAGTSWN